MENMLTDETITRAIEYMRRTGQVPGLRQWAFDQYRYINEEEVMPEQQASRPFQVGDRVRIAPSSQYYSQQPRHAGNVMRDAVGVVNRTTYGPHVNWEQFGYSDGYDNEDLILVPEDAPQGAETPYARDIILVLGDSEYVLAQAVVSRNQSHEDLVRRMCNEHGGITHGRVVVALTISEARKIVEKLLRQLEIHQAGTSRLDAMLDWRDR